MFIRINEEAVLVEELHSNHKKKENDQSLICHTIYTSREYSSFCEVADDSDVFVLLLYAAKNCQANGYFRQSNQANKESLTKTSHF